MTHNTTKLLSQRDRHQRFHQEIWPEAPMLMRTSILMTSDTAEAEDLVQNTLLKAFRSLEGLQSDTNPRAWLLTMLRRLWIDQWRKQTRRPDGQATDLSAVPEPQQVVDGFDPIDDTHWQDPEKLMQLFGDQQVIDALHQLPEAHRWTLLLVDVQAMSIDESAAILEVAPGTVKSRLHRGRAMLRDHLYDFALTHGLIQKTPNQEKLV